jgi:hypothetical protein
MILPSDITALKWLNEVLLFGISSIDLLHQINQCGLIHAKNWFYKCRRDMVVV